MKRRTFVKLIYSIALLPLLVACASDPNIQGASPRADRPRPLPSERSDLHGGILERIDSARSPADHLSLAAHFEQQAEEREERSRFHVAMAARYDAGPAYGSYASDMRRHCLFLASQDSKSAADLRAMAGYHRRIAGGK